MFTASWMERNLFEWGLFRDKHEGFPRARVTFDRPSESVDCQTRRPLAHNILFSDRSAIHHLLFKAGRFASLSTGGSTRFTVSSPGDTRA
jgi:hypothetical protein